MRIIIIRISIIIISISRMRWPCMNDKRRTAIVTARPWMIWTVWTVLMMNSIWKMMFAVVGNSQASVVRSVSDVYCSPSIRRMSWSDASGSKDTFQHRNANIWLVKYI